MFLTALLALSSPDALAASCPHPSHQAEDKASRKEAKRALDLELSRDIDASADAVWEVLGTQYTDVDQWAALVPESREATAGEVLSDWAVAASAPVHARTCVTGFGTLTEVLIAYDDAGRTFTFRPAGLPDMIVYSQNATVVESTGDGTSRVTMRIHMVPKGMGRVMKPMMAKKIEAGLTGFLGDLEHYVENGEPSPAKVAATASASAE
ncbi:MAG: SRPBCC family protein [Proteobacteria bacterium]|nr:SRPBCC family protein [Pseudomonadota bacterium]MCP4918052.1 SRPBCC family protein [Pseudomonadota bacterium]